MQPCRGGSIIVVVLSCLPSLKDPFLPAGGFHLPLPFVTQVHSVLFPDRRAWVCQEVCTPERLLWKRVLSCISLPPLPQNSFQLEYLHCSWGSFAEHLPALYWCWFWLPPVPSMGWGPRLGFRPGSSPSPRQ